MRERKRNSAPIPKEKEFRDQKGKQWKIISTPNLQMKKNWEGKKEEKIFPSSQRERSWKEILVAYHNFFPKGLQDVCKEKEKPCKNKKIDHKNPSSESTRQKKHK